MGFVIDSKENEPLSNNPPVSTYSMNSTTSANQEYWKVLNFLIDIATSNQERKETKKRISRIKKGIDTNWEKQAKSETWVLLSDAMLKFSPAFIFGALAFSVVTNPNNWIMAIIVLGTFLATLIFFYAMRNKHQAQIYKVDNLQNELREKLREEFNKLNQKNKENKP